MAPLEIGDIVAGSHLGRQVELEIDAISAGVKRYRKLVREATERGDAASLKPVERLLVYWFEPLRQAIREEQRQILAGQSAKGRRLHGPLVMSLKADKLAVITLHSMLSRCLLEPNGDLVVRGFYAIGNAVVSEIHAEQLQRHEDCDWGRIANRYRRMTPRRLNQFAKQVLEEPVWNRRGCVATGSCMSRLAIEACLLEVDGEWQRAFQHAKIWHNNQKVGAIQLTDAAHQVIEDGHAFRSELRPRFLPMVVEPYPWSDEAEGGYVKVRTPLIAKPTKEQTRKVRESDHARLLEAMNAMNSTAWTVNDRVAEVMRIVWSEMGGGVGKIPPADKVPMPPRPEGIDDSDEVLKAWKAEAHAVHTVNSKNAGWRAEFVQMMGVAERMQGFGQWYLPHQIDFRGRFYPIPLHLNHHGHDVPRSLMLFAEPVPLTEVGRRWLRIHAANCWGWDKMSLDARDAQITEMRSDIRRIYEDPIRMVDLWSKADEPWQFLAACFALCDDEYGERLPVQLDGTCNGMQHYCAASRDADGGKWVNLLPSTEPMDAYSRVLRSVLEIVAADTQDVARMAMPHLDRKLVKQPVMTSNYNVTFIGMRNQVRDQLRIRGVSKDHARHIAPYVATNVRAAIDDVFSGPQNVMRWMEASAKAINKAYPNRAIEWPTPLGFTAVQPYRKGKTGKVRTALQEVNLLEITEDCPVYKAKQKQGLPPNIVHSWDAAHLAMSAIEMRARSRAFAGVHDSAWTHAEHADELKTVLAEAMIRLHGADQISRICTRWADTYPAADIPLPPKYGNLDLERIRKSEYFFS